MTTRPAPLLTMLALLTMMPACSADDPPAESEHTTASPAPSPSGSQAPKSPPTPADDAAGEAPEQAEVVFDRPSRPDALDAEDHDGALAAAQYFIDLYNYGYTTGDMSWMGEVMGRDCQFCQSLWDHVEGIYAGGGRYAFGGMHMSEPVVTAQDGYWSVTADLAEGPGVMRSEADYVEVFTGEEFPGATLLLGHTGTTWLVLEVLLYPQE